MADADDLRARLDAVRAGFVADLPKRAAALQEAWDAAVAGGWRQELRQEFHRLVHSLSGAGATFGFPELSECAHALEERLQRLPQGAGIDAFIPSLFAALLAALGAAADRAD